MTYCTGLDEEGRRPGQGPGCCVWDLQVRGEPHLCRPRQGAGRVPLPTSRPLAFPYVFADATYVKGRVRGRVVSRAVVVATGVTAHDREVLGIEVGDSETGLLDRLLQGLRPGTQRVSS